MDSLQTIGIQITMNYSVIDNQENDGSKAHHIHSRRASPSTDHPEDRDTQDTGHKACLDHQAPGQTG